MTAVVLDSGAMPKRRVTDGLDETALGLGPAVDTEVVLDCAPTGLADAEAWSLDTETEQLPRAAWRSVWASAALTVFAGLVVAMAVAAVGITTSDTVVSTPSSPTLELPPTPTAPIPDLPGITVVVPQAQHKASPDDIYLAMLNEAGISVGNVGVAEGDGRNVCTYVGGHGVAAAVNEAYDEALKGNPSIDYVQAQAIVRAAVTAYCPEYGG